MLIPSLSYSAWASRALSICVVALLLFISSQDSTIAAPKSKKASVSELLKKAKSFAKEGKNNQAEYLYRKLLFINPASKKYRKEITKLRDERLNKLLKKIEEVDPEYDFEKLEFLEKAYLIDPSNKKVIELYEGMGYKYLGGQWIKSDRAAKGLAELDKARAVELGLDKSYKVIRKGPERFFTNLDQRSAKSLLKQVVDSNLTHLRMFRQVMSAFYLSKSENIDIVLYDSKQAYMAGTQAPAGSAGVYIPSRKAGFFYKDGGIDFATMLHEMTHQHNDKTLNIRAQAWFEEGMSEYFGSGYMTKGGKKMKLGVVDTGRLAAFRKLVKDEKSGGYIPLKRFSRMAAAELTSEFYSEAWALVYYLMEIHPSGRLVLFDYIATHTTLAYDLSSKEGGHLTFLEDALKNNGLEMDKFEANFKAHYRGEKTFRQEEQQL